MLIVLAERAPSQCTRMLGGIHYVREGDPLYCTMPRPKQIPVRAPLTSQEVNAASYAGSKEHKSQRWWGGLPGARVGADGIAWRPKKQLTTIGPLVTDSDQFRATTWVREALA